MNEICKLFWEPIPSTSGEARGRRARGETAADTDVKGVTSVCLCLCAAAVDEESAARPPGSCAAGIGD